MSTRTQIGFYTKKEDKLSEPAVLVYRHHDGYPEGVIPDLTDFLKPFHNERGLSDIEYGSAWLVAKMKDDYLSVGICTRDHVFHGDIEYFYAVYTDGTIRAYGADFDFDNVKTEKERFELLFECSVNDITNYLQYLKTQETNEDAF